MKNFQCSLALIATSLSVVSAFGMQPDIKAPDVFVNFHNKTNRNLELIIDDKETGEVDFIPMAAGEKLKNIKLPIDTTSVTGIVHGVKSENVASIKDKDKGITLFHLRFNRTVSPVIEPPWAMVGDPNFKVVGNTMIASASLTPKRKHLPDAKFIIKGYEFKTSDSFITEEEYNISITLDEDNNFKKSKIDIDGSANNKPMTKGKV